MMDSAALYHSVSPELAPREARLCLAMGTNCLRSMAGALNIAYDSDPLPNGRHPAQPGRVRRGLSPAGGRGFPLERDADEAWRHFEGWRVNYEPIVDALTRIVVPPPAPWFLARPHLGAAEWPVVLNRTPDEPEGSQFFGSKRTFRTPSERESKSS